MERTARTRRAGQPGDRCKAGRGCDMERESMEFDVVIVGAGTLGALDRDQVAAALRGTRFGPVDLHRGERLRDRCPHSVRGGAGAAFARRAVPRLEGPGRSTPHPRAGGSVLLPDQGRRGPASDAAADAQQGQLHHQPWKTVPLARRAGRGARCLHISRVPCIGGALPGRRRGQGCRSPGQGGRTRRGAEGAEEELRAGIRAARPDHGLRRRLPRPPDQVAVRTLRSAQRGRPADLRHRHQGAVGDRSREARAGAGRAHPGVAARPLDPTAARFSTTWRKTRSRSGSWSGSTTPTRT